MKIHGISEQQKHHGLDRMKNCQVVEINDFSLTKYVYILQLEIIQFVFSSIDLSFFRFSIISIEFQQTIQLLIPLRKNTWLYMSSYNLNQQLIVIPNFNNKILCVNFISPLLHIFCKDPIVDIFCYQINFSNNLDTVIMNQ